MLSTIAFLASLLVSLFFASELIGLVIALIGFTIVFFAPLLVSLLLFWLHYYFFGFAIALIDSTIAEPMKPIEAKPKPIKAITPIVKPIRATNNNLFVFYMVVIMSI